MISFCLILIVYGIQISMAGLHTGGIAQIERGDEEKDSDCKFWFTGKCFPTFDFIEMWSSFPEIVLFNCRKSLIEISILKFDEKSGFDNWFCESNAVCSYLTLLLCCTRCRVLVRHCRMMLWQTTLIWNPKQHRPLKSAVKFVPLSLIRSFCEWNQMACLIFVFTSIILWLQKKIWNIENFTVGTGFGKSDSWFMTLLLQLAHTLFRLQLRRYPAEPLNKHNEFLAIEYIPVLSIPLSLYTSLSWYWARAHSSFKQSLSVRSAKL